MYKHCPLKNIDNFHERPSLSDMCRFTFCAWYKKCYDPLMQSTRSCIEWTYIAKYDITIRRSKRPCAVRSPYFSPSFEDYCYSFLFILLLQRSELIHPFLNAKEAYIPRRTCMNKTVDFTYFSLAEQLKTLYGK